MSSSVTVVEPELTARQRSLVESVAQRITKLAASIVRSQGAGDVDDIRQLGMELAARRVRSFRESEGTAFYTYLYPWARRAMMDGCIAEREQRIVSHAMERGTRVVLDTIEIGDVLNESEAERRTRREQARFAIVAGAILGLYTEHQSPEDLLILEQERAATKTALDAALATLDDVDRALVSACNTEELSLAEAARKVGLAYDKARYRYTTAMASIGRRLKTG